jgi:hypothetical protein
LVEEFLRRMPVTERLASVNSELARYLTQEANPVAHEKCLPDYCYNIFEKFRRTYFKAFPNFSDTITLVGDPKALPVCKTIEDVKRVVKIDWVRMGTNERGFWTARTCPRFQSGDMSPHSKFNTPAPAPPRPAPTSIRRLRRFTQKEIRATCEICGCINKQGQALWIARWI